ncbi:unnamed protein product [Lactuca virosa]|uniref:Serine-threonine/tyrosine-protein kinase catalytic domain-containing protein n=1 Tax=Lactuca virosa TaxID=75947 RepID=A0AAU9N1X7_9ASTR|nr:unnamed protein product [Lactuca virosa]
MSSDNTGEIAAISVTVSVVVVVVKIAIIVYVCNKRSKMQTEPFPNDSRFIPLAMVKFLDDMEREKPIRFTAQQLRIATENFSILLGSAKLCNRDNTHITMTGGRGTPGYAAPELWLPLPVSHKCDVYSFGMLLFEIIGRRRNMDVRLADSQQWFPIWVWGKYERKELKDLMIVCAIEEKDHEAVERMLKVAICCVQYRPETRPVMSIVVKMLEGALPVPEPLNPFSYLFSGANEVDDSLARLAWNGGGSDWSSSDVNTKSTVVAGTPLMRRHEITMASE